MFFKFVLVFYHLCYEGSVDLDSIKDLNQRHAFEVQIMEFGQIPKQIFTVPHPQRILKPVLLRELSTEHVSEDNTESNFFCQKFTYSKYV